MDADGSVQDGKSSCKDDDRRGSSEEPKCFPLLNALSDLLMLPKDMLMDRAIRMEVHYMITPSFLFFSFILQKCFVSSLLRTTYPCASLSIGVSINQSFIS